MNKSPAMPDDCEALDTLRRKLRFRAWHRGTCEADLLIGSFADRHLAEFSAGELHEFECLLDESDPQIDDWMSGRQPVPRERDNAVMALLIHFYAALARKSELTPRETSGCAGKLAANPSASSQE
jgi:antitoxin CptB